MCLHSCEMSIPDYAGAGKPLVIRAPLPGNFRATAEGLGLRVPLEAGRKKRGTA